MLETTFNAYKNTSQMLATQHNNLFTSSFYFQTPPRRQKSMSVADWPQHWPCQLENWSQNWIKCSFTSTNIKIPSIIENSNALSAVVIVTINMDMDRLVMTHTTCSKRRNLHECPKSKDATTLCSHAYKTALVQGHDFELRCVAFLITVHTKMHLVSWGYLLISGSACACVQACWRRFPIFTLLICVLYAIKGKLSFYTTYKHQENWRYCPTHSEHRH